MLSLLLVIVLFAAIGVYARSVEPNLLIVRKIRIPPVERGRASPSLRIALLSDLHYPRWASFRLIRRAIAKANAFDPDLVFILGDLFDKNRGDAAILPENIGALFEGIRSRYGVYGVLGNHDNWFGTAAIRAALEAKTEIRLLENAAVRVETPGGAIYIAGVGDLWTGIVDYENSVREAPSDASILLLSHHPDVVERIHDARIRIQFSGHTHGGQVRLPFIGALHVPSKFGNRYCKGLIRGANHLLYVNSGICSMKRVRFLWPPEVTWVEMD